MATISLAVKGTGVEGTRRFFDVDVTFTGSYTTGGDAIPLAPLGIKELTDIHQLQNQGGFGVELAGTKSAPLLRLFESQATQMTAASIASRTLKLRLYGA